jgi:Brp/Blh family beta-carotene 15,15'-monooxygenase
MKKNKNISIAVTFLFLALSLLLPSKIQQVISFAMILTAGVVHGANDLYLLQDPKLMRIHFSYIKSLILYLLFVLVVFSGFYFFPILALIFFVPLSAYHFGEQHWSYCFRKSTAKVRYFYFSYGALLFALLFYFNQTEVQTVVSDLSGYSVGLFWYQFVLVITLLLVLVGVILVKNQIRSQALYQLFVLVLLSAVFYFCSLVVAFAVYFVFWHSIPSIKEQSQFLFGDSNNSQLFEYVKKAFLYWLFAMILLGVLFVLLKDTGQELLSIFFCFLAAITFPHAFVILKMKDKSL